jgi:hypothetical protein
MSDEERATLGFISGAISAGMTNTTEPSADDAARLRDLLASLADESNVDYEEQHEIAQIVEANIDVICAALSASPAPSQSGLVEAIAESVKQQVDDGEGFWHICSGCSGIENPRSDILQCEVGMGCRECGGLGAIWDGTDYAGLAHIPNEAIIPRTNDQTSPDGLVGKLEKLLVNLIGAHKAHCDQIEEHLEPEDQANFDHWEVEAFRILSALTARDNTALLRDIAALRPVLKDVVDDWCAHIQEGGRGQMPDDVRAANDLITRIDTALAGDA